MRQQRGIALITILVMVALATILAATIAKRQANTADATAYLMRQDQSLLYAKSAETFFSELLRQDSGNAASVDHLQEIWAQPMPAFPVEDGYVTGVLEDESGKFNLNNLLDANGQVNEGAKQWFEQLLRRVGLPIELSQAVIDWQDADDLTAGAMGAESGYYQGLTQAYLPANSKFNDVAELKQVRGFEREKYALIAPYISALPDHTLLNINTAPALVLAGLDEQLDVKEVEQVLTQNKAQLEHFSSAADLWSLPPFNQVSQVNRNKMNALLGVKSNYFRAEIDVMLSQRQRHLSSALLRKGQQVWVWSRSLQPSR